MAKNIQQSQMAGIGIPNVYISGIFLETAAAGSVSAAQAFHDDPHVDSKKLDPGFPNVNHVKDAARNDLDNSILKVTLNLVFKDVVSNDSDIPWLFNDDFINSYKVVFVQSTNPVASGALLDKNMYFEAPKFFDKYSYVQGVETSEWSLAQMLGNKKEWSKNVISKTIEEGTLYKITTSMVFNVKHHNPNHLAFFLVPFLDISEFTSGTTLGSKMAYPEAAKNKDLIGKPLAEIVIENGSVSKGGIIYRDQSNKVYTGPVHWDPPKTANGYGHWKKGESISDQNFYYWDPKARKYFPISENDNGVLKAFKVTNTKVQDFRLLNKLEKVDLNFTPLENKILSKDNPQHTKTPVVNEGYFTDLKLSRDSIGRSRFLFGMDWGRIIRANSAYPVLYDLAKPEMVERFVANSLIRSMKIIRRRIEEVHCENQLIDSCSDYKDFVDTNEVYEIIAIGGEKPTNLKTKNFFQGVTDFMKGGTDKYQSMKKMGGLREIDIAIQGGLYANSIIRHFTGVDESILEITDGVYQYGVEMEIEDGVYLVLQELVSEANSAAKDLKQYLYDSSNNTDPHTNSFSEAFRNGDAKKYSGVVVRALTSVENMLRLTTKKPGMDEILRTLTIAISPETGSPAGLEVAARIIRTLRDKIVEMLQSTSTSKRYKNPSDGFSHPSQLGAGSNKSVGVRYVKVEHFFRNPFDSDVDKNAGYEYLSQQGKVFGHEASSFSTTGLITLTRNQFKSRTAAEMRKMFSDDAVKNSETQPLGFNAEFTKEDTLENARYRFLAPSHVLLPNMSAPFEQIDYGPTLFLDYSRYVKLLSDILVYNRRGGVSSDANLSVNVKLPFLTEEEQKTRQKLSDVFFSRSCVVERKMTAHEAGLLQGIGDSTSFADAASAESPPVYGQLFGVSSDKTFDSLEVNEPSDILVDSYDDYSHYYKDIVNPNSLLLTLMNVHNFGVDKKKVSEKRFDLHSPDNVVMSWAKGQVGLFGLLGTSPVYTKAGNKVINSPNHMKYWFLKNSTGTDSKMLRHNGVEQIMWNADMMKTQTWYPAIWANFKNLVEIQVLLGYEIFTLAPHVGLGLNINKVDNFTSMKGERWVPLTANRIKANGNYLCRMVPYTEPAYNIRQVEDLQLPMYHEYFVIKTLSTEEVLSEASKAIKEFSTQKMESTIKNYKDVMKLTQDAENISTALVGNTPGSARSKRKLFGVMENEINEKSNRPIKDVGRGGGVSKKSLQKLAGSTNTNMIDGIF